MSLLMYVFVLAVDDKHTTPQGYQNYFINELLENGRIIYNADRHHPVLIVARSITHAKAIFFIRMYACESSGL